MSRHDFSIPLTFKHRIIFTRSAFSPGNPRLREVLEEGGGRRALVVIERAVADAHGGLVEAVRGYFSDGSCELQGCLVLPGGEAVKSDEVLVERVWAELDCARIDRHSYLLAIGGGAFLDAVGHAAATAHRGVRLVRFPTTTLSQDDSGVGVKCAVNRFGKKNWVGSFAVPFAVVNDFDFLVTQPEADQRAGLIEAVKVALVKDGGFFEWIEDHVGELAALQRDVLEECVKRSALLHARHIAEGGDPFEAGSSRPLDFGHWAAHKLESMTAHDLPHAQAVAVGLALDTLYSREMGYLSAANAGRVLAVVEGLGLEMFHPALVTRDHNGNLLILNGLDEFREHLGGRLTVLLLAAPGRGIDVHEMDSAVIARCISELEAHHAQPAGC